MSNEKQKAGKSGGGGGGSSGAGAGAKAGAARSSPIRVPAPPPVERGPLFRRVDWLTFGATTLLTLVIYLITLAPDLTLEDCGELAVASYYLGVPHAPGYPIWTLYTWFFTVILPFSNVAWRVAVSSAVAAALASGMLGLMVSRASSLMLEGIDWFKGLDRRWEEALCLVSGVVAAMLLGFNGFMWSQAVIVEVYTLSVLSLMGVLVCLLHWTCRPQQKYYLYIASFLFGICFNNHQTLIVAAMGLQVAIAMVDEKLGRDALFVNVVFYFGGLVLRMAGVLTMFNENWPLFIIYNLVGLGSLGGLIWLTARTQGLLSEWRVVLITLGAWVFGASFYLLMPLFSMTNPPMNWAYPRTFDGFIHAFTRGQYEKTNPTDFLSDPLRLFRQLIMYGEGAADEFNLAFLVLALVPFAFFAFMKRRERAWIVGNAAIGLCLSVLLLMLLNPQIDRQSRDLTRVFFTASHVTIAMFIGLGLTMLGAALILRYQEARTYALYGGRRWRRWRCIPGAATAGCVQRSACGRGGVGGFVLGAGAGVVPSDLHAAGLRRAGAFAGAVAGARVPRADPVEPPAAAAVGIDRPLRRHPAVLGRVALGRERAARASVRVLVRARHVRAPVRAVPVDDPGRGFVWGDRPGAVQPDVHDLRRELHQAAAPAESGLRPAGRLHHHAERVGGRDLSELHPRALPPERAGGSAVSARSRDDHRECLFEPGRGEQARGGPAVPVEPGVAVCGQLHQRGATH
ncbi:MAG: DUF2723 domain-containing protein [Verrucomicrobia bacterium]|nr:DUF2723 domain-containing protein [Verrucomicrobiota bacterium]